MARLPPSFSMQAVPIRSALAEGRTEDARRLLVDLLRTGTADAVVQSLAADMLKPPARKRGRQSALPRHWMEISERFRAQRSAGAKYEDALREVAEHFGYSETHVRSALSLYEEADINTRD